MALDANNNESANPLIIICPERIQVTSRCSGNNTRQEQRRQSRRRSDVDFFSFSFEGWRQNSPLTFCGPPRGKTNQEKFHVALLKVLLEGISFAQVKSTDDVSTFKSRVVRQFMTKKIVKKAREMMSSLSLVLRSCHILLPGDPSPASRGTSRELAVFCAPRVASPQRESKSKEGPGARWAGWLSASRQPDCMGAAHWEHV